MMMHWASPNDLTEGKPRQFSHDVKPSLLTNHQCGKPGLTIQMWLMGIGSNRANWCVIWRGAYIGPFSRPGNWANFPSLSCHLLCSDTFCQLFPPRSDLLPPFARELKVDLFAHAELKVFLCKVFPGSRSCLRLGIWARHRSRCCQQAALWLFSRIGHRLLYVGAPGNLDLYLNSFSISSLTTSLFLITFLEYKITFRL